MPWLDDDIHVCHLDFNETFTVIHRALVQRPGCLVASKIGKIIGVERQVAIIVARLPRALPCCQRLLQAVQLLPLAPKWHPAQFTRTQHQCRASSDFISQCSKADVVENDAAFAGQEWALLFGLWQAVQPDAVAGTRLQFVKRIRVIERPSTDAVKVIKLVVLQELLYPVNANGRLFITFGALADALLADRHRDSLADDDAGIAKVFHHVQTSLLQLDPQQIAR